MNSLTRTFSLLILGKRFATQAFRSHQPELLDKKNASAIINNRYNHTLSTEVKLSSNKDHNDWKPSYSEQINTKITPEKSYRMIFITRSERPTHVLSKLRKFYKSQFRYNCTSSVILPYTYPEVKYAGLQKECHLLPSLNVGLRHCIKFNNTLLGNGTLLDYLSRRFLLRNQQSILSSKNLIRYYASSGKKDPDAGLLTCKNIGGGKKDKCKPKKKDKCKPKKKDICAKKKKPVCKPKKKDKCGKKKDPCAKKKKKLCSEMDAKPKCPPKKRPCPPKKQKKKCEPPKKKKKCKPKKPKCSAKKRPKCPPKGCGRPCPPKKKGKEKPPNACLPKEPKK